MATTRKCDFCGLCDLLVDRVMSEYYVTKDRQVSVDICPRCAATIASALLVKKLNELAGIDQASFITGGQ